MWQLLTNPLRCGFLACAARMLALASVAVALPVPAVAQNPPPGTAATTPPPRPPAAARPSAGFAVHPSFDCSKRLNATQRMICGDATLSGLDAKLGQIFSEAWKSMPQDKSAAYFAAEQREWARNRDGCQQTAKPSSCLSSVYRTRIAELQGRFRLVPARGPFRFACDGEPPRSVVITWFETDPPSGQVETAEGTTTVFSAPSGGGARYLGSDLEVWEHQGELSYNDTARKLALTCRLPKAG